MDIKKYGYYYKDDEGNIVNSSVIAGVERDSLRFDEVKNVFSGQTITREIPTRYYKSFKDLNIRISPTSVTISNNPTNKLVYNCYIPVNEVGKFEKGNYKNDIKNNVFKQISNYLRKTYKPIYDLYNKKIKLKNYN